MNMQELETFQSAYQPFFSHISCAFFVGYQSVSKQVYQCQSLMFTKQKTNVEHALNQLMDIYNDKKDRHQRASAAEGCYIRT